MYSVLGSGTASAARPPDGVGEDLRNVRRECFCLGEEKKRHGKGREETQKGKSRPNPVISVFTEELWMTSKSGSTVMKARKELGQKGTVE